MEEYFKGLEDKNAALGGDLGKLAERVKMVEDYKADRSELKKA